MGHLDIPDFISLFFYLVITNLLMKFHDEDKLTLDPKSVDLVLGCKQNDCCLLFTNLYCFGLRIPICL